MNQWTPFGNWYSRLACLSPDFSHPIFSFDSDDNNMRACIIVPLCIHVITFILLQAIVFFNTKGPLYMQTTIVSQQSLSRNNLKLIRHHQIDESEYNRFRDFVFL